MKDFTFTLIRPITITEKTLCRVSAETYEEAEALILANLEEPEYDENIEIIKGYVDYSEAIEGCVEEVLSADGTVIYS